MTTIPIQYVKTKSEFEDMMNTLKELSIVAIDAEGVQLSRTGPLTILSIGGIDKTAPIYVVDVQTLGADVVFTDATGSLKSLLENAQITKVTFDCRSDSDALWHQFGVSLTGVLELQVLDQAVRIQRGETPPQNCLYVNRGQVQMLQGLEVVAKRNGITLQQMNAPHKSCSTIWARRPLDATSIEYAANDILAIKLLYHCLQSVALMPALHEGVRVHSKRYEVDSRELPSNQQMNKREELPIVDSSCLPRDHEHRLPDWPIQMKGRMVWDRASIALRFKRKTKHVFNDALFVLQHDDWYTQEAYEVLSEWIDEYPHFTAKQRGILACPPTLQRHDENDWGDY